MDRGPVVGIGACLVGQKVRYSGEAKKRNRHIETLANHVDLRAFCPEVAMGLGIPRKPLRLVGDLGKERLTDSATQAQDYSQQVRGVAQHVVASCEGLSGYVLVKASPSCGFERVKRYNENGSVIRSDTSGLFAQALAEIDPLLPLEEDGRLNDASLRENFVSRVFAYHDWHGLCREGPLTRHGLIKFWSRYKYLMMACHIPTYKEIGRMLAHFGDEPLDEVGRTFIRLLMQGLGHMATRKSNSNVLQHLRGYLKAELSTGDKGELDGLIDQYRGGYVPLVVPVTLLKHHFRNHRSSYIDQQVYLAPYPEQMSLRNRV